MINPPCKKDSQKLYEGPEDCLILVPCANGVEFQTDESLRILEQQKGYRVWRVPGWSAIDQCRSFMAYDAICVRGYKSILWVDSDIEFDPNDVDKIIARNLPIVAATYPFKGTSNPTCLPREAAQSEQELVQIDFAATGFLYTKAEVFFKIKEKMHLPLCNIDTNPMVPFFQPMVFWENGRWHYVGEDYSFCLRARKSGYNIILDNSIKLGHIGKLTYKI